MTEIFLPFGESMGISSMFFAPFEYSYMAGSEFPVIFMPYQPMRQMAVE
jgi:hypothetical protein